MKTKNNIWALFAVFSLVFLCGCMGGAPPQAGDDVDSTFLTTVGATTTKPQSTGGISLESLLGLKLSGYVVTYDVEVGSESGKMTMTQTQYVSGNRMRFDISGGFAGAEDMEMRSYIMDDAYYSCVNQEGSWTCMKFESKQEDTSGTGLDLEDMSGSLEDYLNQPTYEGTRIIAGVVAQCFKLDFAEGSAKYCLHPTAGVPLYVESIGKAEGEEGYYKMEATRFSAGDPGSNVFVLPAEPMDMEAYMAQMMAGMDME